jgi:hypothetical protein
MNTGMAAFQPSSVQAADRAFGNPYITVFGAEDTVKMSSSSHLQPLGASRCLDGIFELPEISRKLSTDTRYRGASVNTPREIVVLFSDYTRVISKNTRITRMFFWE